MSNYRAIGAVSATLRHLLEEAVKPIEFPSQRITVDIKSPNQRQDGDSSPAIYILLYQAAVNANWRNVDLPTRGGDGRLAQRPALGLDLSYLLTFYGSGLEPDILMGRTVSALHAQPLLSQAQIAETLTSAGQTPSGISLLKKTDLSQVERIRFSPIPLNLEELSKLWSVLIHKPYALSMAYQVSVLLIEAEEMMPVQALPVYGHGFSGSAAGFPQIEQILPQFVQAGDPIILRGRGLVTDRFTVQIGKWQIAFDPAQPAVLTEAGDLQVTLPADLPAGIQPVQVIQQITTREHLAGDPRAESRSGTSQIVSNTAVFVLRPRLTVPAALPAAGPLTVQVAPPVFPGQRGVLLLNEWKQDPADPAERAAYSLDLPPIEQETDQLEFPASGVAPGTYLVRVQIDGAESSLELEQEAGEPAARFAQPKVVLT